MKESSAALRVGFLSRRLEASRQMQIPTHKDTVTRNSTPRMTPIMIPVCLAANISVYNKNHQIYVAWKLHLFIGMSNRKEVFN